MRGFFEMGGVSYWGLGSGDMERKDKIEGSFMLPASYFLLPPINLPPPASFLLPPIANNTNKIKISQSNLGRAFFFFFWDFGGGGVSGIWDLGFRLGWKRRGEGLGVGKLGR